MEKFELDVGIIEVQVKPVGILAHLVLFE